MRHYTITYWDAWGVSHQLEGLAEDGEIMGVVPPNAVRVRVDAYEATLGETIREHMRRFFS